MANMMVRDLPDLIHKKLKSRAAENSRSLEAEARSILSAAVSGEGFGDHLRERFAGNYGDELDVTRTELPDGSDKLE